MTSFDLLERIALAATNGERCPKRHEWAMRRLVTDGWVEIEIYARNWRVAKIVRGRYAGLATLGPAYGAAPWLIRTQKSIR